MGYVYGLCVDTISELEEQHRTVKGRIVCQGKPAIDQHSDAATVYSGVGGLPRQRWRPRKWPVYTASSWDRLRKSPIASRRMCVETRGTPTLVRLPPEIGPLGGQRKWPHMRRPARRLLQAFFCMASLMLAPSGKTTAARAHTHKGRL